MGMKAIMVRATNLFFTSQSAIIGALMLAVIYLPSVIKVDWALFTPSPLHLEIFGMVFALIYFVCLARAFVESRGRS